MSKNEIALMIELIDLKVGLAIEQYHDTSSERFMHSTRDYIDDVTRKLLDTEDDFEDYNEQIK